MGKRKTFAVMIWFLGVASFQSAQTTNCDSGWFGSSCQFKCRCQENKCSQDGSCDSCQQGWFGRQCQYVDLAFNRSTVSEITDNNDGTCLTSGNMVEVTLGRSYVFTWLRVYFSHQGFLQKMGVQFTQNSTTVSCNNWRSTSLDMKTLDIYCDLRLTVHTVRLTGEGVQHLCSVYVSGGRNVALRQPTQQSSTYSNHSNASPGVLTSYTSDKAVDDITDQSAGQNCSSTAVGDRNNSWTLTFREQHTVTRYVLYFLEEDTNKPNHLMLTSYGVNSKVMFQHSAIFSATNVSVYTALSPSELLFISRVTVSTDHNRVLALCEVQLYGDSVCKTGQFGHECELSCNCDQGQLCFVSTGQCPRRCSPGFKGFTCNEMCEEKSYGYGCNFGCSPQCKKPEDTHTRWCHLLLGSCTLGCLEGFSDAMCSTDTGDHYKFNLALMVLVPAILLGLMCTSLARVVFKRQQYRTAVSGAGTPDLHNEPSASQTSLGETIDGKSGAQAEESSSVHSELTEHVSDEVGNSKVYDDEVKSDASRAQLPT